MVSYIMRDKIKQFEKTHTAFRRVVYLCYLVYGGLFALLCFCMRIFPIQENKILCCSKKGKRCNDNPMYIAKELAKRNGHYEIIWLTNQMANKRLPQGMRYVKMCPLSLAYELATSRVWIDSNTKDFGTLKRKNQLYIQTWHASYSLKKFGRDFPDRSEYIDRLIYPYNAKIIDLFISNSKKTSEIYRSAFGYRGEILECGSPRNDIFFRDPAPYLKKVRNYFNIHGQKIALYAPTFRNDFSMDAFSLDYFRLKRNLEKRFGGERVILIKLHLHDILNADRLPWDSKQIMNATYYDDMQELLVACDILITDYSSSVFDFAVQGKICFLYATDIDKYKKEQGWYFELGDLPFPLAQDDSQLEKNILLFDENRYREEVNKLFHETGLCENGDASSKTADFIEQWIDRH